MLKSFLLSSLLLASFAFCADDEFGDGFCDETQAIVIKNIAKKNYYFVGNVEQLGSYATHNQNQHNDLNSPVMSVYLEYEQSFTKNHKLRVSSNAFYNFIYDLNRDRDYSQQEKNDLKYEAEIFDLYLQGKISPTLDYKIGRQVVIWGRSDTIRVTDVLNPLDNRTPGIVDIEDLRLSVGMAKFDYYFGDWNANFIVVGETRYSKNPVYGGDFYPFSFPSPSKKIENKPSLALSLNGTFSGWDLSLYAVNTTSDAGHVEVLANQATLVHEDLNMLGFAFNYLHDSWLLKSEAAYFDGYKFSSTGNKTFKKLDALVGLEYNGFSETGMALELANRHMFNYDDALKLQPLEVLEDTTQYAFRANSDFLNATLKANFLISLFGKEMNQGGFSRLWFEYAINDNFNATLGYVDYLKGSNLFDVIDDNDMFFASLKYSF